MRGRWNTHTGSTAVEPTTFLVFQNKEAELVTADHVDLWSFKSTWSASQVVLVRVTIKMSQLQWVIVTLTLIFQHGAQVRLSKQSNQFRILCWYFSCIWFDIWTVCNLFPDYFIELIVLWPHCSVVAHWCKFSVFTFIKVSLDCWLWQWYAYLFESAYDVAECCREVALHEKNDSVIIHFNCSLWAFRMFDVAELFSGFVLF